MPKQLRKTNIHILMNATEASELAQLVTTLGVSAGHCVRQLTHNAFNMVCHENPVCATGQRCFVPQMHGQPPHTPRPARPSEQADA